MVAGGLAPPYITMKNKYDIQITIKRGFAQNVKCHFEVTEKTAELISAILLKDQNNKNRDLTTEKSFLNSLIGENTKTTTT